MIFLVARVENGSKRDTFNRNDTSRRPGEPLLTVLKLAQNGVREVTFLTFLSILSVLDDSVSS